MNLQLHGMGALPSPPDPRDWQITDLLAADGFAAAMPSRFVVSNLPPVLDQGLNPTCVAHSHSSMKAWMDHIDQGKFPNFNEPLFHRQIGGTSQGAVARYALDRMKEYGYPVVTLGDAGLHKITAYYAVAKDINVIKQALMSYGPLTMLGPWYPSWINNLPSSNILPAPFGIPNGHCVLVVGWDDSKGFLFQNSWGLFWGDQGRAWMPYGLATVVMWEFWKAIDQYVRPAPLPDTSTPTITAGGLPVTFKNRTGWRAAIKAGKPRRAGATLTSHNYANTTKKEAFTVWGEVVGQNFGTPNGTNWYFGSHYINGRDRVIYIPAIDLTDRNF